MRVIPSHSILMLTGLILAPLLPGVINRTKAVFAGRHGPPLFQTYRDIFKLLRKSAVYSRTTTWIFRATPALGLAAIVMITALLPMARLAAPLSFTGDFILFAYALGFMRFLTIIAALDTGSSFEGMGASREAQFSALAEPALIVGLAALVCATGRLSLSGIFSVLGTAPAANIPAIVLVAAALLIVFLAENSRIPVDDPNTHLELTMIHEVMILDYSGPDLAMILYAATLKLWVLGALIVNLALALTDLRGAVLAATFAGGMLVLAVAVGIIESSMARLSLIKVPRLLAGALVLAVLAFSFIVRSAT